MKMANLAIALAMAACLGCDSTEQADRDELHEQSGHGKKNAGVQLGPRPFYLVEGMDAGKLKETLQQCASGPFFSQRLLDCPSRRGHAVPRAL